MGCGFRGANLLLRGHAPSGEAVVHPSDACCKSHRLQVRSGFSAEALAAAHYLEGRSPTSVTLRELRAGARTPIQLENIQEL
eukprot:6685386-Pyramimonas_sp.AAC.1